MLQTFFLKWVVNNMLFQTSLLLFYPFHFWYLPPFPSLRTFPFPFSWSGHLDLADLPSIAPPQLPSPGNGIISFPSICTYYKILRRIRR